MKYIAVVACLLLLTSCMQENNPRNLRMGDVTLGQQLIDLKKALEAEAISEDEFEQMKDNLVNAASMCDSAEDDDTNWFF